GEIAQRSRIAEGDLVGLLQKSLDILGQLRGALAHAEVPPRRADRIDLPDLLERLAIADDLLRRGVVEESYRWAISGPPEREDGARAWELPPDAPPDPDHRDTRDTRGRRPSPSSRGPKRPAGRLRPRR